MYVTRPLSLYIRNLDDLSSPPPEGPNSGYLVLQDEESTTTCCFGLCKNTAIRDLPFPQNKLLVVTSGSDDSTTSDPVHLIPAINQPLSSNIYYAIKPNGKHKGRAYASSTDEDMVTCCFCNCVKDVEPRPFDPTDVYQQFKFSTGQNCGSNVLTAATSVASNGHPPLFLRRVGWSMYSRTPKNFSLGEAEGLDPRLRAHLPDFGFPLSDKASKAVVVGKWYCPFMFIRDVLAPKDQVKKSMFYEMTLEQQWERIFLYDSDYGRSSQVGKTVMVDVIVQTEAVTVAGTDAMQDHQEHGVNSVVWFKSIDGRRDEPRVGLSSLIVERMMWEEKRAGWIPKKEKQEKVLRTEEFGGIGASTSCGCYMLVERFVLKRMDGTVLLTYSFNHTHNIRSKWA